MTAALSEVTGAAEVSGPVGDEVRRAVGADEAMLAVGDQGGEAAARSGEALRTAEEAAGELDDHMVEPLMPERLRELVDRLGDGGEAEATA